MSFALTRRAFLRHASPPPAALHHAPSCKSLPPVAANATCAVFRYAYHSDIARHSKLHLFTCSLFLLPRRWFRRVNKTYAFHYHHRLMPGVRDCFMPPDSDDMNAACGGRDTGKLPWARARCLKLPLVSWHGLFTTPTAARRFTAV